MRARQRKKESATHSSRRVEGDDFALGEAEDSIIVGAGDDGRGRGVGRSRARGLGRKDGASHRPEAVGNGDNGHSLELVPDTALDGSTRGKMERGLVSFRPVEA